MKKIQEWTSKDSRNVIVLPPWVMERLKHRVLIQRLNDRPISCWCESIEHEPMIQSLTPRFVLFDTSDRHEGITLIARRTLYAEVQYLGQFTATMLPMEESDEERV